MPEPLQEQATAVLRRMVEAHPLSQVEIQKRAGLNGTYFARIWRTRTPGLASINKVLRAMDVSLEEFWRRVTVYDPAEHLKAPTEPSGKEFRHAMRTVFLKGGGTATSSVTPGDLAVMARTMLPGDLERSFRADPRWHQPEAVEVAVEHLALVRYCDPGQSIGLAGALLGNLAHAGDRDLFVAVARALIESHRLGGWLTNAVQLGRWLVVGDLAQSNRARVGTYLTAIDLLNSKASYRAALGASRRAVELALRCDPTTRLATHLSLARTLDYNGMADQATCAACFDLITRAPSASWRLKFSAHHFATLWLTGEGRIPEAQWHLQALQEILPKKVPYFEGCSMMAEAGLARKRGHLGHAITAATRGVELFSKINPFDTALASLDLADLEIDCGLRQEALETLAMIKSLLTTRETNEIAEAALVQLNKIKDTCELSARLEKIRLQLINGRSLGLRPQNYQSAPRYDMRAVPEHIGNCD